MYTLRCTVTSLAHTLTRMWLDESAVQALMSEVTYLHPALGRSSQWDLVEVTHSRMGLVTSWTPETGWTPAPGAVVALLAS